jgi:hypothetical protein
MPTVPTYNTPRVNETALPGPRFSDMRPEMSPALAGGLVAEQQQKVAQGLNSLGTEMFKQQIDAQNEANQLRVDDALNKAKEAAIDLAFNKDTGYTNLKGVSALERDSGKPLSDEYTEKLQGRLSDISNTLGNDRQRRLFDMHANDMTTQFRGDVMRHEGEEFKSYQLSVREGTIANRTNEIGLFYNDPARVDDAVLSIKAAVADIGRTQGKSAEWIESQTRKMTSNAHKTALQSALEKNDVMFADQYLKKYAGQMDADDILAVNGLITKQVDAKIATAVTDKVFAMAAPKFVTPESDRLLNLVKQAESGGQRYGADGKLLTSPKGAQGEMQVMPHTAKDPGFGVQPARDDSPAELARVGRDYLQAMLQKYKGNVAQALAAYNAGPGAVDAAMGKSQTQKTPDMWLAKLPQETQGYVKTILAKYSTGDGQNVRPTLQDIHAGIRQQLGDASPSRLKLALEEGTRRFTESEAAIKQHDEETVAEAQRQLLQNGGSFAALPPNLRAAVPPGKVDDLMEFSAKIAKGVPVTTDWALYYGLKTNPDALGKTNLMAMRNRLSDADFKSLAEEQQHIRAGRDELTTNLRSTTEVVNGLMRQIGIDPTPKDTNKEGAIRVGKVWQAVTTRVREEERTLGRKLRPEEVEKTVGGLFSNVEVARSWWFNDAKPAILLGADDRVAVPDAERERIQAQLRAAKRPTTDAAVEAVYRRSLGLRQ